MVISIDKATAVRMFDKVKKYWVKDQRTQIQQSAAPGKVAGSQMKDKAAEETDMTVVVSQSKADPHMGKRLDIRCTTSMVEDLGRS